MIALHTTPSSTAKCSATATAGADDPAAGHATPPPGVRDELDPRPSQTVLHEQASSALKQQQPEQPQVCQSPDQPQQQQQQQQQQKQKRQQQQQPQQPLQRTSNGAARGGGVAASTRTPSFSSALKDIRRAMGVPAHLFGSPRARGSKQQLQRAGPKAVCSGNPSAYATGTNEAVSGTSVLALVVTSTPGTPCARQCEHAEQHGDGQQGSTVCTPNKPSPMHRPRAISGEAGSGTRAAARAAAGAQHVRTSYGASTSGGRGSPRLKGALSGGRKEVTSQEWKTSAG
eukprot:256848-Pelagomonas_calceolata.AAC.1